MKKRTASALAGLLVASLALTGCGSGRSGETTAAGTNAAKGFAANATIGVALPWLGTQNWKEAQDMFTAQLKTAGFTPMVQAADNKAPQQSQQIDAMVKAGAKVIVVGAVDGTQLGTSLKNARDAGVAIIGYDRLIQNTEAVDALVQFGSVKTGELQGQSLLEGLAKRKGAGPYNIELFGGGPSDANAPDFFKGAMSVLQPKIDAGLIKVVSGQNTFTQVATVDWDNAKAQSRMDSLLSGFYSGKKVDGVLSPNDGIARAILTSCKQHGYATADLPVVDGLDAENESVTSIWNGEQYSTTAKPTDKLVGKSIDLIKALQAGQALPAPSSKTNNGKIDVPVYQLDPTVVTKDNAKQVFASDPERLKLLT